MGIDKSEDTLDAKPDLAHESTKMDHDGIDSKSEATLSSDEAAQEEAVLAGSDDDY